MLDSVVFRENLPTILDNRICTKSSNKWSVLAAIFYVTWTAELFFFLTIWISVVFANRKISVNCFSGLQLYTLKTIGILPNLHPGEEPLSFRTDIRNLKSISETSRILFGFRTSARDLKGSSPGYRFGNVSIFFRV